MASESISLSRWGLEEKDSRRNYLPDNEVYVKTPGDILLSCRPFVHIVSNEFIGKVCDLCLRRPRDKLRRCADCEQVAFCEKCIESSSASVFKSLHMLECQFLDKYRDSMTLQMKIFFRLFLRLTEENSDNLPVQKFELVNGQEPSFHDLRKAPELDRVTEENLEERMKEIEELMKEEINEDWIDSIPIDELALIQFILLMNSIKKNEDLAMIMLEKNSTWSLWELFTRLWCNTIGIHDETIAGLFSNRPIGLALYLEQSLIISGHSCQPNFALAHYGTLLQIRSISFVTAQEERCLEYADALNPLSERIRNLRNFFVDRCCDKCLKAPTDKIRSLQNQMCSLFLELFEDQTLESKLPSRFKHGSISREMFQQSLEQVNKLFLVCCTLRRHYLQIYPTCHPNLSRLYVVLLTTTFNQLLLRFEFAEFQGKSETLKEEIQIWLKMLKAAKFHIASTHGVDHPLFKHFPIPLCEVFRRSIGAKPPKITIERLCEDNVEVIEDVLREIRERSQLMSWSVVARTKQCIFGELSLQAIFQIMLISFTIVFGIYVYHSTKEFGGFSDFF